MQWFFLSFFYSIVWRGLCGVSVLEYADHVRFFCCPIIRILVQTNHLSVFCRFWDEFERWSLRFSFMPILFNQPHFLIVHNKLFFGSIWPMLNASINSHNNFQYRECATQFLQMHHRITAAYGLLSILFRASRVSVYLHGWLSHLNYIQQKIRTILKQFVWWLKSIKYSESAISYFCQCRRKQ